MDNVRIPTRMIKGRDRTRQLVRCRDKYTCQDCGAVRTPEMAIKSGKKLFDIHHLNGLCGKRSRKYDKVTEIDGLITLCHRCHFQRPEHKIHSEEYKEKRRKLGLCKVDVTRYKDIRKMREQRFTLREIGEKYGVSRERIRQILLKPHLL